MWTHFKRLVEVHDILPFGLIIAVSISSFVLGRMSATPSRGVTEQPAMQVSSNARNTAQNQQISTDPQSTTTPGSFIASKNGTKYFLPWCAGALQIKDANKVWFASKEEAEKAGYKPAGNCPGI